MKWECSLDVFILILYYLIFVDCKCNRIGRKSNICNKLNGECECKKGYSVLSNCQDCDDNYVKDNKAVCVCRYTGINCQECNIGYMKEASKSNGKGSKCVCENGNCQECDVSNDYVKDSKDICVCRKGYIGNNCQSCDFGYKVQGTRCVLNLGTGPVPIRKCCNENEVCISVLWFCFVL